MCEILEHPLWQAAILLIAAAQFSCGAPPDQYYPFAMAILTPLSMTFLWMVTFNASGFLRRVLYGCIIAQAICLISFNAMMIWSLLSVLF